MFPWILLISVPFYFSIYFFRPLTGLKNQQGGNGGRGQQQQQGGQWQQEMSYNTTPNVGGNYPPSPRDRYQQQYGQQQQQQQGYGQQQQGYGQQQQGYGQQQQQQYQNQYQQPQQQNYNQPQQQPQAPPRSNASRTGSIQAPARSQEEFFHQCEVLSNNINVIQNNTAQIKDLNNRILGEVNISRAGQYKQDLDRKCEENSSLVNETRNGIKILSQAKTPSPPANVKNQQYARIVQSLKAATREFFTVEAEVKQSGRDQFARQYRIARPYANDQEIDEAIETGRDVFSQELMSSRVQDQRRQLDAVQERARALNRIQESMNELLRIVQELDAEIDKQQVFVDEVQRHVESAAVNASAGVVQLNQSVNYAASARKKQMWIFIIILIVLLVVGGVIGIYVATNKKSGN
ncbi:Plasma membrane t-SNARE, secretory vesicle fusion [Phlyctochytrium planicorne]|nr:Plasma membrane t-SNARE, secretory vesicle fusion [Phlyctochytrium planicorne]